MYIKHFAARPSLCDRCGRGRNKFVGRVQNNHVHFSFTEMAIIFLEIVKATAGLDTLRCRLCKGCHCGRLPLH